MFGDAYASLMVRFVILLVVAGFAAGMLAMWGLPKLWALIKPLIHAATA